MEKDMWRGGNEKLISHKDKILQYEQCNVKKYSFDRLKTLRRRVEWNLPVSSIHFFVKLAPKFKLIGGQIAD